MKLKKMIFTAIKVMFFEGVDIEKALLSNKILLMKKIISTLLVTCIIGIKLNHYM